MIPLYAALAASAAALVVTYLALGKGVRYSRRLFYALLRAGALALLAFVLLRPERTKESEVVRRRTLALALDSSRSMSLPVSPGSAYSRRAKVEEILRTKSVEFDALGSRYDLAVYEFDREARRLEGTKDAPAICAPGGSGEATALGNALLEVLDGHQGGRLAGVLVISDGASNLGIANDEAARAYAARGTPVHAIAVGEAKKLADLSVESLEAPSQARVGSPVRIVARVRVRGIRPHEAVVTIRAARDGRSWEELERREVSFTEGGAAAEVVASFTPRSAGTVALEAEVETFTGEAVTADNRRMTFVDVEDSSLRVLYIEGVLRPDFRALRRALGAAGQFELDLVRAFLRRPGGGPLGHGIRLTEYDVFVVGEMDAPPGPFLREVDRLVREDGRGLVVFSGPRALAASPLARGLPVKITDDGPSGPKRVRPTAAGGNHPALRTVERIWATLGPLGDLPRLAEVRRTGEALLVAEGGVPVLVAGRAGAGRVAVVLSGKTHVWRDDPRAPRGAYERLARSLVAWAAGRESSDAILSVDVARHSLYAGDEVTLAVRVNRARAREAGLSDAEIDRIELTARIEGPLARAGPPDRQAAEDDASVEALKLRRRADAYTGTIRAARGGVFRIVVGPSKRDEPFAPCETMFVVETDRREFETLAAEPEALKSLTEATGGLFATADDPDEVIRALLRAPGRTVVLARRRESLWDRAWVGALFLGCLFLEWWMRRR